MSNHKWSNWHAWFGGPLSDKPESIPDSAVYEALLADGDIVNGGGPYCGELSFCDDGSGIGRNVVAYRYRIQENEMSNEIPEDLKLCAEYMDDWPEGAYWVAAFEHRDGVRVIGWPKNSPPITVQAYSYREVLQARKDLGLIMSDAEAELPAEDWAGKITDTPEEAAMVEDMVNGKSDMVNAPPHYQLRPGYEVYDLRQDLAAKAANGGATYAQYSDWDRATEYLLRMWGKNKLEDLKKCRWYVDKLIEKLEAE